MFDSDLEVHWVPPSAPRPRQPFVQLELPRHERGVHRAPQPPSAPRGVLVVDLLDPEGE